MDQPLRNEVLTPAEARKRYGKRAQLAGAQAG